MCAATTSETNRRNPLSLDGRGIKGEGENDAPHRHVIADLIRNPEVKGRAHNKPNQPTESPLP